ncbi:Pyruvate/2-oxoglutarate dehydrogenase complex, dihydrolipoamide dehydrogenase (E3) component [Streptomyces sp. cf386]|uniref:NAD(P)/FAD-dependent oxidoreductase n=1 Tax=Streptomyces sp. cf386 TaxID=1761904 RepID=UPI000886783B|nr:NAD(P)/FAD-dependent oxidoreductase [Streptomyces sp. cf386]SDN34812.1 Pyruvate/2-oxoglutarate dehydrogenase complex, dihydrolipoamide dehydrogenase (E3) component [Streptomyces sp. cf386]
MTDPNREGAVPHLAVIGAGPAGLAATVAAAALGVRVTLVDSAAEAGGQFYRRPAAGLRARRPQALHHQWRTWERLRDALEGHLRAGTVRHLTEHHVWFVERRAEPDRGFTVHALLGPEQEEPAEVRADAVLLATGGYEKVLPFPGWTLPGVITPGGAQAMLKGALAVSGRTAVVAGTGPLLLPVATGLAAAGVEVAALVDSADPKAFVRQSRALAAQPGKVVEGAGFAARLLRHRVRLLARHTIVEAHGSERLEAVTVAHLDGDGRVRPGSERRIPCDTLAVGHGMLPHTDLAETLGCRLDGLGVHVDAEQRTDVPGVWAAGETTGIGGNGLSLAEGHIAGRSAAARLCGTAPDPGAWAAAAKVRTRLRTFFAALDSVYAPPAHWTEQVTDDTVVCRCEEVTGGAVREAVAELGAGDPRTVKLLTRAGMGWCQGRMCGPAVAGLAGCELTPSRRPFARPVPLGVLARAGETDQQ